MRRDEIWNQKLLLAGLGRELVKQDLELVVGADAGLHHHGKRTLLGVLGGNLEVASDVMRHQFLHVLGALHRQVVAHAGADQDLLDALDRAAAPVQVDQGRVVGAQVLADAGVDTTRLAAGGLDLRALAAQAVHVGGRTAEVGDGAGETLDLVADVLDLAHHRIFGAALYDAALMLGDRAKSAATKTAAHDVDREADHLPGRDFRAAIKTASLIGVRRMRAARIGQIENEIHFSRRQGDRWRRDPDIARRDTDTMRLHQ